VASFIINNLNKKAEIHGDAAIGLVSSVSVAIGVMIPSIATNISIDFESYLFGSILFISKTDVIFSVILSVLVIGLVLYFYNSLFAITFDEEFAQVKGLNTRFLNSLISILTSVTIVLGIRVVGTLLISSMIIFPTVSALQLATSFKKTMLYSASISVFCIIAGIFLSYTWDLPTGASIVILNAIIFLILFSLKKIRGR
jgi:zinc transport system permease protein